MGMNCWRLEVRNWYGRKPHSIPSLNLTLCSVETSNHQSMAFALAESLSITIHTSTEHWIVKIGRAHYETPMKCQVKKLHDKLVLHKGKTCVGFGNLHGNLGVCATQCQRQRAYALRRQKDIT